MAQVARKAREGTVVSDRMDKTVVVAVSSSTRHRLYKKLARHRPEDACPLRVLSIGQDDRRVIVEADVGTVIPAIGLGDADDDRPHEIALFDAAARSGVLHRGDDYVTYAAVTAP